VHKKLDKWQQWPRRRRRPTWIFPISIVNRSNPQVMTTMLKTTSSVWSVGVNALPKELPNISRFAKLSVLDKLEKYLNLPKECPDCAIMLTNKIGMQDG
jgi:hypothetical protein